MSKVILLLLIIGVKILLTKGLMLGFLLLCMAIKGKALHKNSSEWDKYFLSLEERKVLQFAISLSFIGYYFCIYLLFAFMLVELFISILSCFDDFSCRLRIQSVQV